MAALNFDVSELREGADLLLDGLLGDTKAFGQGGERGPAFPLTVAIGPEGGEHLEGRVAKFPVVDRSRRDDGEPA